MTRWKISGLARGSVLLGMLAVGCGGVANPTPTPDPNADDTVYVIITATPAPVQTPAPTPDLEALIESSVSGTQTGDVEETLIALEQLRTIEANDQAQEAWITATSTFYTRGEYAQASVLTAAGLEHYPDNADLLFLDGMAALTLDDHEAAIESFSRLVDLNPDDFRAWHLRGIAHMRHGESELAISAFERAVALGEDAGVAGNNVAFEAIADLANALAVEDEQQGLLYLQDKRIFYRDNFYGALPGAFLAGQARMYTRPDQNEIALDLLNRAIQRNYIEGYYYRAQVWQRMGEVEKAIRDLEAYLEVKPVGLVSEWTRTLLAELQGD